MSLIIYLGGVLAVIAVMLSSYFLGERTLSSRKSTVYEGGVVTTGTTRIHFFAHYFLVAILFVAFDMESVFVYLYSSSAKAFSGQGFLLIATFLLLLLLSLVFVVSMGVLKIGPRPRVPREVVRD